LDAKHSRQLKYRAILNFGLGSELASLNIESANPKGSSLFEVSMIL
jgi:hypothetical protein